MVEPGCVPSHSDTLHRILELIDKAPDFNLVLGAGLLLTTRLHGIPGVSDQIIINGAVCGSLGYLEIIRTTVVDDAGAKHEEDGFFIIIYNSMHFKVTQSLDVRVVLARCRDVAGTCLEMEMRRYHARVGKAIRNPGPGFVNVLLDR
jgi:hypothetical protein